MSESNFKVESENELNISDLFLNLLNYKIATLVSIFIPILLSIFYLSNRDIGFTAEIEIFKNEIIQSLNLSSSNYTNYSDYSHSSGGEEKLNQKIDADALYLSFMSILNKIDQTEIDELKFIEKYGDNLNSSHIEIKMDKRNKNRSSVTFKYNNDENISKVINELLFKVDLLNKQSLEDDLENRLYYISFLKDDARIRHNEQIDLKQLRLINKISYLKDIQDKKLKRVILRIRENLEIANAAGIIDPIISEDFSFNIDGNKYLKWNISPDKLLNSGFSLGDNESQNKSIAIPSITGQEFSNIINTGIPLFYYGSKVLEKELDLIKSRNDPDLFTPGLNELEAELKSLESQKSDAYVIYLEYLNDVEKNIFSQLKIVNTFIDEDNNKQTAIYNIDKIKVDQAALSSYVIIILSLLFGIIIASVVVTVLRIIDNYKIK